MVWPFSRGRNRRFSSSNDEKHFDPSFPQNATPRSPPANPEESSLRKRRRSSEHATEKRGRSSGDRERLRRHSKASVEDITALPGVRRLERSPHLRRSDMYKAVVPHQSGPVPASKLAAMAVQSQEEHGPRKGKQDPGSMRRLSKRQEHHVKALREKEIRQMSSSVNIPKRNSGHGDMQNRENKKARRAFSSRFADDKRSSAVSLPFQESIHSSMSATSDQKGWEIPKLDILTPRPTVRLASSQGESASFAGPYGLSRNGSKKERLPALKEGVKKRDRRRVAELADDLDASDLRVLMERDTRRKDKKKASDLDKVEAKLRRRADRARARERDQPPMPPTAIHPAFRAQTQPEKPSDQVQAPPTPVSDKEEGQTLVGAPDTRQDSTVNEDSPFRDPSPSPFADPRKDPYKLGPQRGDTPHSNLGTPMETPMEDPVLATAEEIRYSQGRLSHISMSPPHSPVRDTSNRNMSPLRREYTPDLPPLATSSTLTHSGSNTSRKLGTWASIFRRGGPDTSTPPPKTETSFSNTSRDSMSKQPIPAHLMGPTSRRRSGTPQRTQSIFREDLPESPTSMPGSRVNSPDVIAAANYAAARRSKRAADGSAASPHDRALTPERSTADRSDSPANTDGRNSTVAMSTSLASIDSEGSWLTGRPSKRRSNQSQIRSSIGSVSRRRDGENPSYEDLGMPDEQYVRRLTPNPEDDDREAQAEESTPKRREESTLMHRNTSRRKPNLVLREDLAKSREGLVADVLSAETPTETPDDSSPKSMAPSLGSESDNDQLNNIGSLEQQNVVYGRGHARQLSSGSAKLLDIPSRTRSGRNTPDARMSVASNPDSLQAHSPKVSATGLQSPPLSPAPSRA